MTDDIVALLRSPYTEMNVWELVDKAADEITRLRTELEAVKAERDELDALYHEGGTMETQLADAEARATEAEVELEAVKREAVEALKPTHRHLKSEHLVRVLGVGKMQTENWYEFDGSPVRPRVDMREVVIYEHDGSLWARPREEFIDGRFEVLNDAAARAFVEKHGRDAMVDRYSLEAFGDRDDMWPRNDGQWVRYFDYDALSAKRAEAEKRADFWMGKAEIAFDRQVKAEAKLAEVERLTAGLHDEVQFMRKSAVENRQRAETSEARVAELEKEVVFGFYEEERPLFAQGYEKGINELSSPVTAEECKGYVDKIVELEDRVAELEKALNKALNPSDCGIGEIDSPEAHVEFMRGVLSAALSATKEPKPDTPHRAGGQAMTDAPREIIEEARRIAADIASSSNYSVGVIADALIARDKRAAEKCNELAKAAQALIDRPAMFGWQYDAKVWVITEKRAYEKASTAILTYDTPTGQEDGP